MNTISKKAIQESQSSATSLLGNVQATYNPCQATSMPDATKTAFTKSTVDGVLSPYVAQSVKSATDCGRIE